MKILGKEIESAYSIKSMNEWLRLEGYYEVYSPFETNIGLSEKIQEVGGNILEIVYGCVSESRNKKIGEIYAPMTFDDLYGNDEIN